jgi:beta-lactamase regulating signal transducer with metallopeptidase domain
MESKDLLQVLIALGRVSVQGGVLVLVILLAQWLFRKQLSPRWRCTLWLLVVARLLLPVSFATTASIFNWLPNWTGSTPAVTRLNDDVSRSASQLTPMTTMPTWAGQPSVVDQPTHVTAGEKISISALATATPKFSAKIKSISWPEIIFVIWLLGVLVLLGHLIISSARLACRFARLKPLAEPTVLNLLNECRDRLNVKTHLTVVESGAVSSPALYGFWHPRLLLPQGFTANFSPRELRFVFLHELAHLKRRDLPMNWLLALLQVVHWFNPLVWLGFARWRVDRELACDALALAAAGAENRRDYGRTILRLLENFTHRAAMPGMVGILEDKQQ